MEDITTLKLNDAEFSSIQKMVLENTGISLSSSKKELVKRRFTPRLKALGLVSFSAYIKYVKSNFENEITNFSNSITTNLTSFFREKHHYDYLRETAIPVILKRNKLSKKLRIWSAGCSTGQEAYCLAMTLRNSIPDFDRWDVKILATDLDEKCLNTAREGVYAAEGFDKVSETLMGQYFDEEEGIVNHTKKKLLRANSELKKMITFNKLNLMNSWPMKGKFDVIFCRNVFIYFDRDVQYGLVKRYSELQNSGSYLCLGHSETVADPASVSYKLMGKTLYIKE